jgi:hypothetical protein
MRNLSRRIARLVSYHDSKLQAMAQEQVTIISTEEVERAVAKFGCSLFGEDAVAFEAFKQQAIQHITAAGDLSQLTDDELTILHGIVESAQPAQLKVEAEARIACIRPK